MATLAERDEILHVDLKGRDPDEGFTNVPYEKGALFLRHLEETFGRARFDRFVRAYFDRFAFRSITTAEFTKYLRENLLDRHPQLAAKIDVETWINKPGLPGDAPQPRSEAFTQVEAWAHRWLRGEIPAAQIKSAAWTTQQWLHFLKFLPVDLNGQRMGELDQAFQLTKTGNSEIAFQWLLLAIRHSYETAYPQLDEFLMTVGRRKFIKPLYEELAKTPAGLERARSIYGRARPGYHPIAVASIDEVLKNKDEGGRRKDEN